MMANPRRVQLDAFEGNDTVVMQLQPQREEELSRSESFTNLHVLFM